VSARASKALLWTTIGMAVVVLLAMAVFFYGLPFVPEWWAHRTAVQFLADPDLPSRIVAVPRGELDPDWDNDCYVFHPPDWSWELRVGCDKGTVIDFEMHPADYKPHAAPLPFSREQGGEIFLAFCRRHCPELFRHGNPMVHFYEQRYVGYTYWVDTRERSVLSEQAIVGTVNGNSGKIVYYRR
jgi:hypothetical protein